MRSRSCRARSRVQSPGDLLIAVTSSFPFCLLLLPISPCAYSRRRSRSLRHRCHCKALASTVSVNCQWVIYGHGRSTAQPHHCSPTLAVWDCIHGLAGDFQSPTALKDGPKVRQRRVRHRRRGRAADCDKTVPGIAKLPKTLAGLGRARFAARALLVAAVIWLAILVASPRTVGSCLCVCFKARAVVMLGVCRDASESFVRVPPRRSRPVTAKPTHRRT